MSDSCRLRSQAGLTMVELIVGMAVTSILLVGITGVLFSASSAYNNWIDRIETSGTGDVLAAALAADSHRFIPCPTSVSELDFCLPGERPATTRVRYQDPAPGPYTLVRELTVGAVADSKATRVLVRNLATPLTFHVTCTEIGNVDVGFISVRGLPGRSDLRVYFQTARGDCESV